MRVQERNSSDRYREQTMKTGQSVCSRKPVIRQHARPSETTAKRQIFLGIRAGKECLTSRLDSQLHARAMRTGSCAPQLPYSSEMPSQPSSMAMAASEAVPTPASSITGTFDCSITGQIPRIQDSHPGTEQGCQRHNSGTTDILQHLG